MRKSVNLEGKLMQKIGGNISAWEVGYNAQLNWLEGIMHKLNWLEGTNLVDVCSRTKLLIASLGSVLGEWV